MAPRRGRIGRNGRTEKAALTDSLHFPWPSGIQLERRVRHRLVPPPFSLRCRRLRTKAARRRRKFPRIRGLSAVEPSRIRTGDCGFRAWKKPQRVSVSVARFGGSDSLSIRLSEGWGSADGKHHGRGQANQRPRMNIENRQGCFGITGERRSGRLSIGTLRVFAHYEVGSWSRQTFRNPAQRIIELRFRTVMPTT
jgi:hypothetical protein